MPIEFNPDQGHLRLARPAFTQLTEWSADPDAAGAGEIGAELADAGALDEDQQPHPALALALAAVADPLCRLAIRMTDGQGRAERGDVWLGTEAAALLLDLPDGRCEFGVLRPIFVPVLLARVVELGPRPRLDRGPVPVSPGLLDQLSDPEPAQRSAAVTAIPAPGLAELRRDWRVQASWLTGDGSAQVSSVRVLDTPAGLWLVEGHGERVMLFPTTPSAIWRALVTLLPTDTDRPPIS